MMAPVPSMQRIAEDFMTFLFSFGQEGGVNVA